MAAAKPPRDVLIVSSIFGLAGVRKGKIKTMPGGIVVLSNTAGPEHIPAELVPAEIHIEERALEGLNQQIWLEEMLDELWSR